MKNAEIIIGEGITEEYYFKSLRDILMINPTAISLKPYNLDKLEKAIRKYARDGYTKIHCLIDMDNKVSNPISLQKYMSLKQKYNRKTIRGSECEVIFYESLPSIEIFLYFYFENSTAEKTNESLKRWLKAKCGYEPTQKFLFKHSVQHVLCCAGGNINNAINNAYNSVRLRDDSYNCSYSELGILIEYLGLRG